MMHYAKRNFNQFKYCAVCHRRSILRINGATGRNGQKAHQKRADPNQKKTGIRKIEPHPHPDQYV